jgi:hypothetical protein
MLFYLDDPYGDIYVAILKRDINVALHKTNG